MLQCNNDVQNFSFFFFKLEIQCAMHTKEISKEIDQPNFREDYGDEKAMKVKSILKAQYETTCVLSSDTSSSHSNLSFLRNLTILICSKNMHVKKQKKK